MTGWDRDTLLARVHDTGARLRHPAASPDAREVGAYAAALSRCPPHEGLAVVLGMTPELRQLALGRFARVVSIDASAAAIDLYREWPDERHRSRESIHHGDWFRLRDMVGEPVTAVLGDGVFGNLPDLPSCRRLLRMVRACLAPEGRLVTRQALIPAGFVADLRDARALRDRFRAGDLDEAEFGFGVRLLGHYRCCYDPRSHVLDNAKLYAEVDAAHRAGEFTDGEMAAMAPYRFSGRNCISPQPVWEDVLREEQFGFRLWPCRGRDWYRYYLVYECWPERVPAEPGNRR